MMKRIFGYSLLAVFFSFVMSSAGEAAAKKKPPKPKAATTTNTKPANKKDAATGPAWEVVGQESFAELILGSSGGVKLAVGKDNSLYAVVRTRSTSEPTNILTAYQFDGKEWVVLGQPKFAQNVGGLDAKVAPDGNLMVVCNKAVYRYDPKEKKFRMGLGTGRGYAGFSWGDQTDNHIWEKEYGLGKDVQLGTDSKGKWYVASAESTGLLFEYNKELASKWTAENKCRNCQDNDVNVEFYPVGKAGSDGGSRTGTEFSPGMKVSEKKGISYMNMAINDKDEVILAYNPAPAGVAWGFEVKKWVPAQEKFVPLGSFTGDEEGNPNGGYSDGRAEQLTMLVRGNEVMLAYKEDSNQKEPRQWKASAMKYNGDTWTQMGKQGFSNGHVDSLTLGANSKGDIFLAYDLKSEDQTGGYAQAVVMKYDKAKNAWTQVGDSVSGKDSAIEETTMVIAPNDNIYIGYRDSRGSGTITVKKAKL